MSTREYALVINFGLGTPQTTSKVLQPGGLAGLDGWSITETTGSARASLRIWDGVVSGGVRNYGLITLDPGESTRDAFPLALEILSGGLFLQVLSGSIEGAVYCE